jgi:hypothetical protein
VRDSVKQYQRGNVPITDNEIIHNAVSIAGAGTSADQFVDVDGFAQAIILVDFDQSFTIDFYISDDGVTGYLLSEKTAQSAGTHAYTVNCKAAQYLNVTITNESGTTAGTLTMKALIASG